MFLVTTADERTWKKDENILFLGEWCKLYTRRHVWKQLDFETLPYHWNDRNSLYNDRQYIAGVYERYIGIISDRLNIIHKTKHPVRYWRILIGVWLLNFMEVLFDRYITLTNVKKTYDIESTWMFNPDKNIWIPKDTYQFHQFYISDSWNHFIYSKIIKKLNLFRYKQINRENENCVNSNRKNYFVNINRYLKSFLFFVENKICKYPDGIFFSYSYLGKINQAKIEISLGQFPSFTECEVTIPKFPINQELRRSLTLNTADNQFEELFEDILAQQFPSVYIEGYNYLRREAFRIYPKKTKAIFTANSYHFNEGFKVWAADNVCRGSKLLISQHGGNMGSSLIHSSEDHQIQISDRFYSWGWSKNNNKVKPMPAVQLLKFKNNLSPNEKGNVLHILTALPRYSYIMYSVPIASQFLDYINDQIALINNLSQPVINGLKIRLDYYRYSDWFIKERLQDNDFADLIDKKGHGILKRLNNCRLSIVTDNSTVFLQTFAADYPTVLFWNPRYYELRPEAKPYYEKLHEAGILHYDPRSAAQVVNEIYDDPLGWWQQGHIQDAKDTFCESFAYTGNNWLREWKRELVSSVSKHHHP